MPLMHNTDGILTKPWLNAILSQNGLLEKNLVTLTSPDRYERNLLTDIRVICWRKREHDSNLLLSSRWKFPLER